MIRTIDGTVYIAKSEVLRIIDEEIEEARFYVDRASEEARPRYAWTHREHALCMLREHIHNYQEQ